MTATITEPTTTTAFMATTSRDALESATKFVAAALPARPPVPVLTGVLLEATDDGITVSGFDFDTATRQRIAGFGAGRVLVAGKLLKDVVTKLAKGSEITLVVDEGKLTVRSGNRTYKLPLLKIEDYPRLPPLAPTIARLEAADVARLAKVTVAAGHDDTLPILTAVRFDFDAAAGTVTAAATDRYRLAMLIAAAATEFTGFAQVSTKTVEFVVKQLAKLGEVSVGVSRGKDAWSDSVELVSFSAGDREITVRTIGGDFPRYRSLVPSEHAASLVVDTNLLLHAIDGAGVVLGRNASVRLDLNVTGATLEAGGGDDAEHSEFVGGSYEGEPMLTAYNPAYLVDGIKAVGGDTVRLNLRTAGKPVVLTDPAGPTGADYLYLLMPVRLSS